MKLGYPPLFVWILTLLVAAFVGGIGGWNIRDQTQVPESDAELPALRVEEGIEDHARAERKETEETIETKPAVVVEEVAAEVPSVSEPVGYGEILAELGEAELARDPRRIFRPCRYSCPRHGGIRAVDG